MQYQIAPSWRHIAHNAESCRIDRRGRELSRARRRVVSSGLIDRPVPARVGAWGGEELKGLGLNPWRKAYQSMKPLIKLTR